MSGIIGLSPAVDLEALVRLWWIDEQLWRHAVRLHAADRRIVALVNLGVSSHHGESEDQTEAPRWVPARRSERVEPDGGSVATGGADRPRGAREGRDA